LQVLYALRFGELVLFISFVLPAVERHGITNGGGGFQLQHRPFGEKYSGTVPEYIPISHLER
jgi:hypothetical protein